MKLASFFDSLRLNNSTQSWNSLGAVFFVSTTSKLISTGNYRKKDLTQDHLSHCLDWNLSFWFRRGRRNREVHCSDSQHRTREDPEPERPIIINNSPGFGSAAYYGQFFFHLVQWSPILSLSPLCLTMRETDCYRDTECFTDLAMRNLTIAIRFQVRANFCYCLGCLNKWCSL